MSNEKKPTSRKLMPTNAAVSVVPADLLTDVRALIEQARDATARAVNSALVLVYWSIGDRTAPQGDPRTETPGRGRTRPQPTDRWESVKPLVMR